MIELEVDTLGRVSLPQSLSRAGRPFAPLLERKLEPDLRSAAFKLVGGSEDLLLLPEFPLPVGVPDLVAVMLEQAVLADRIASGIPPLLGPQRAAVVSVCGLRRPASIDRLVSVTGSSEGHTRAIVNELVRVGALVKVGRGWCRAEAIAPLGKVFALEAKVSDWRAGMTQSLRYGTYAQNVTLVLGRIGDKAMRSATLACKSHGVGLYVSDRWHVLPRSQPVPLHHRIQSSEHVLAAVLHISQGAS